MKSRKEIAKQLTDLIGEAVKTLIFEEIKNLNSFPKIELAIPQKDSSSKYKKTKIVKGIIIYKYDEDPISKKYLILTPKGLEKISESCYGYGENMNKFLPTSSPHYRHDLPLISYLRYQKQIFDKIDKLNKKK